MSQIASRSISGMAWMMVRVAGQAGIGLVVSIILARLLPVADFGLMAISMSFIGLAELVSALGVEAALIQRKDLQQAHIDVAMILALIMASLMLMFFVLTANPISEFFNEPRLADILPVLGGAQWFLTIAMVPRGLLRRRLVFRLIARIDLGSYIIGYALVGMTLAWLDAGIWSLIIGTCVWFVLSSRLAFYHTNNKIGLRWNSQAARDLLSFGVLMSTKSAINYASVSANSFIIGKLIDTTSLGLYARAQQVAALPLQKISSTLSSTMFPVYASIQHDKPQLEEIYLQTVAAVAFLTLPPLAGAAVASEWVIGGLYGDKWLAAAPIFAILCVSAMFSNVFHLAGALVEATNYVWSEVKRQLLYFMIMLTGLLCAAPHGLIYVAYATLFSAFTMYLSMSALSIKIARTTWRKYLRSQMPAILVALLVAGSVHLATLGLAALPEKPIYPLGLSLILLLSALVYGTAFAKIPDKYLFGIKGLLRDKFKNRRKRPASAP